MSEEKYTEEEVKEYAENYARQYAQEKANTHSFLKKVIENDDTTKTGNVSEEELGNPQLTVRGLKELEVFSREVYGDESWADFFKKIAEVQLASSLSKEGFLLNLSVTDKREIGETPKKKQKKNSGWFRKRNSQE